MSEDIRRQYQRYPCDIEVGIINNSGEGLIAESCDISEEGMFLMLPIESVASLQSGGYQLEQGEVLQLLLPDAEHSADIDISASIIHVNPLVDGRHLVGLRFEHTGTEALEQVRELISHCKIQPRGN